MQANNSPNPHHIKYRDILWIVLLLNAGMFFTQAIASWFAHSTALLADAMDFLGDAANYAVSLFALTLSTTWRSRVALSKGVVMATYGVVVIGLVSLHLFGERVPSASLMGIFSVLGLMVNLTSATLLFAFRKGDSNMLSVWLDSRNDVLVNLAVLLAALGVWLTQHRWPDLVVAVLIALLGISSGYHVIRKAVHELRTS